MKTIAVIGANGKSGQAFVQLALNRGYHIRAGIHHTNTLPDHEWLDTFEIDATNQDDVKKLLRGAKVVVSLIGHGLGRGTTKDVQSVAIANILKAMESTNARRIISLTGTGVRFPGDHISLADYALNTPLKLLKPNMVNDGIHHAELLRQSNTDWTVVRALKLADGKAGEYKLTENGPAKLLTPRAEVAEAILEVIEKRSFIQKAPVLSLPNNK